MFVTTKKKKKKKNKKKKKIKIKIKLPIILIYILNEVIWLVINKWMLIIIKYKFKCI